MRILFYIPAITPWWFEHILVPMIDTVGRVAEVHVVAPEPWCGTGIGAAELERCSHLAEVQWHLIGGPDHPSLRTRPLDPRPLIDFVHQIAPDHVICRSADRDTPRHFPGQVHFLMEGGVAPFQLPPHWVWLADDLFDHGFMPALDVDQERTLSDWLAPAWDRHRSSIEPQAALLPAAEAGRDMRLLLPLEYEHEENFFLMHRPGSAPNSCLVADLTERLPDGVHLFLTDHPLNHLHVDGSALRQTVAVLSDRVTLLDRNVATAVVAQSCDGMLIGDSKAFGIAGFWGTPLHRSTRFRSAEWLDAYDDLDAFLADLASGRARRPQPDLARLWAAYHLANNVFDPQAADFEADTMLDRLMKPVNPGRWAAGMARADLALEGRLQ